MLQGIISCYLVVNKRWLSLALILFLGVLLSYSQTNDSISNWHLLDYEENGVYGASVEKAYRELLMNKVPDTIIIAVIDTGVDIGHEDLQGSLWTNAGEKGNDEDRNGYTGDVIGWNFLGNTAGENVSSVPYEWQRVYYNSGGNCREEQGNIKKSNCCKLWNQARTKFQKDSLNALAYFQKKMDKLYAADSIIRNTLNQQVYTYNDLAFLKDTTIGKFNYVKQLLEWDKDLTNQDLIKTKYEDKNMIMNPYTLSDYRTKQQHRVNIIGDNIRDIKDVGYGNGVVTDIGGHGTHVAGIIGAIRNNHLGAKGISNALKLMVIRAIPAKGDEYDKDVALSIRYAVDNGAKVINMSFGKELSPNQKWVEKAIRYAAKKNVLVVNGAGNNGKDIDEEPLYPTSKYLNKNKRFSNMITVGASGLSIDELIGEFSNYGAKRVDVFAPGVNIYSTTPGNHYRTMSGTSMAAPVISGIAGMLLSYYPKLTAKQVKFIIEKTVIKIDQPVKKPGFKEEKNYISMGELCRTGGIVNAYNAIQLARSIMN